MPRVLVILAESFEEIEAVTPIDLLRRAGADVTLASLSADRNVTGRCGLTLRASTRRAGTAPDFGLVLVEQLFSTEKAAEISRSLCA